MCNTKQTGNKMIQITDKSHCCGCTACIAICPKQCITMKEDDKEGFFYPVVDSLACINCGLCQKVCPMMHQDDIREPLNVYAAKNKDEKIRLASSSGGIFTLLAERVINEGGVVFGARFNTDWEVIHDYTETKEGLAAFRRSKYVQSYMGDCYQKVKSFLQQDRKVMFTGTPCQIAGLKNYLRKDYDNLLTLDVVCHGVPSPKVWRMYLNEITCKGGKNTVLPHPIDKKAEINSIDFRSKSIGWKKFSFALTLSKATANGEKNSVLLSSIFTEDPYINMFISNLSLQPSCYNCPSKAGKSGSDITIADFWGIEKVLPEFDDDKGISLILSYTGKGIYWLKDLNCEYIKVDYQNAQKNNPYISNSATKPINRNFFFHRLKHKKNFQSIWEDCSSNALNKRIRRFLYRKFNI